MNKLQSIILLTLLFLSGICPLSAKSSRTLPQVLSDSLMNCINQGSDIDYQPLLEALENEAEGMEATDSRQNEIYFALSSYYRTIEFDFASAHELAQKLLVLTRQNHNPDWELRAINQMTYIYELDNDSICMAYAKEGYEKSKLCNNPQERLVATFQLSAQLKHQRKFNKALDLMHEAQKLASTYQLEEKVQSIYSNLAELYWAVDSLDKAEEYYRIAMTDKDVSSAYDRLYARFSHVWFLKNHKRNEEALECLAVIEQQLEHAQIPSLYPYLYEQFAHNHEMLGHYTEAIHYYKKMAEARDSLSNRQKNHDYITMAMRKALDRETEISHKREEDLKQSKSTRNIIANIAILSLICLICLSILFWRRNMQYHQLTALRLQNMHNEQRLRDELKEALQINGRKATGTEEENKTKYASSSLSEQKLKDLFFRLEQLMLEQKVYTDSLLSIDKLAQMLGTNRTYLSQAINEETKDSYSAYINRYRVDYASLLLSDSHNDDALRLIASKSGFNSLSSFYIIFKKTVGMSPSIFRENAKKFA